jgi:hypothetical protein
MISVVGIGTAGSAIAEKFTSVTNYDVYLLNSAVHEDRRHFKLKTHENPEDYERGVPELTNFFSDIRQRVQVFAMGSAMSSNYVLGILEQLQDHDIDLFYIRPDIELITATPLLLEKIAFSVLQEYARSGLFKTITLISNADMERALDEIPIKAYYDTLNERIFSTIHYLNYFEFSDPEIGQVAKAAKINRIRSIGILDIKNLEEKWFFELDNPREIGYYICINEKRLAAEGGLHKKLVTMLKEKPKNAYRKISYAIYETEYEDFGFCVAHTNVVQQHETLDSSS